MGRRHARDAWPALMTFTPSALLPRLYTLTGSRTVQRRVSVTLARPHTPRVFYAELLVGPASVGRRTDCSAIAPPTNIAERPVYLQVTPNP